MINSYKKEAKRVIVNNLTASKKGKRNRTEKRIGGFAPIIRELEILIENDI